MKKIGPGLNTKDTTKIKQILKALRTPEIGTLSPGDSGCVIHLLASSDTVVN